MPIDEVHVLNLIDALRQLTQYLAIALTASFSALVLEVQSRSTSPEKVTPSGPEQVTPLGSVPMSREAAQLVLIAVAFLTGLMGSFAVESAGRILPKLSSELAKAACTFSSVATAPTLAWFLAAFLPVAFVAPTFWHRWKRLKEAGILLMFVFYAAPYVLIGIRLASMKCRA